MTRIKCRTILSRQTDRPAPSPRHSVFPPVQVGRAPPPDIIQGHTVLEQPKEQGIVPVSHQIFLPSGKVQEDMKPALPASVDRQDPNISIALSHRLYLHIIVWGFPQSVPGFCLDRLPAVTSRSRRCFPGRFPAHLRILLSRFPSRHSKPEICRGIHMAH